MDDRTINRLILLSLNRLSFRLVNECDYESKNNGICYLVSQNLSGILGLDYTDEIKCRAINAIIEKTKTWEKFSGSVAYPVPSPSKTMTSAYAFGNLPKWKGDYGYLRFDLLEHLIAEFEKESLK